MTNNNIIFIGFDTAKTNTEVAYVEIGYDSKPVYHSKIRTTKQNQNQGQPLLGMGIS
jgi:hypothetical protein